MAEYTTDFKSSSTVSDLVAGFLIDLARAQHMSNLFSAELEVIYRENPLLRVFPVPNGYIAGVNLDLKLTIEGVGIDETTAESFMQHVSSVFNSHVAALSPAVAEKVARKLEDNRQAFGDPGKAERMADALRTNPLLDLLRQQVLERVQVGLLALIGSDGELREQASIDLLISAFESVFLDHADYRPLPAAERLALKSEIEALIREPETMNRLRTLLDARLSRPQPRVRVVTSGESLSSLSPDFVGQIQLNASIRDYLVQALDTPGPSQANSPQATRFRLVPAKH